MATEDDNQDELDLSALEDAGGEAALVGLSALDKALRAAAGSVEKGGATGAISEANAHALGREFGRALDGLNTASASAVDQSLSRAVRYTADVVGVDTSDTAGSVSQAIANLTAAVADILDKQRVGGSIGTLLVKHAKDASTAADTLIGVGRGKGLSEKRIRRDLASLLRGDYPPLVDYGLETRGPDMGGLRSLHGDIRRIVVTESNNAMRAAGTKAASDQGYDEGQWTLSSDHDVEDDCDDLEGEWFPLDAWPDAPHPYALLGGARVRGAFVSGMTAHYVGDVVTLRTSGGRELTVTTQHPVLTARWIAKAGRVREGDDLVCYCGDMQTGLPWVRDEHDAPPRIEEVVDLLRQTGRRFVRDPQADHLHGEGARIHGQIEIVLADGLDRLDLAPALLERYPESDLGGAAMELTSLHGSSPAFHLLDRLPLAADSVVGRAYDRANASRVVPDSIPPQYAGLGHPAQLDTVLPQSARERRAAYAAFLRKLLDRHAGLVTLDRVCEVRYAKWDGQVYDLGTKTSYIIANDILVSNCACYPGAVRKAKAG